MSAARAQAAARAETIGRGRNGVRTMGGRGGGVRARWRRRRARISPPAVKPTPTRTVLTGQTRSFQAPPAPNDLVLDGSPRLPTNPIQSRAGSLLHSADTR